MNSREKAQSFMRECGLEPDEIVSHYLAELLDQHAEEQRKMCADACLNAVEEK